MSRSSHHENQARAEAGKTDAIDGTAAALSILHQDTERLLAPRAEDTRSALNVLAAARERIDTERIRNHNALNALASEIVLGIDARKAVTDKQVKEISAWRGRSTDTVAQLGPSNPPRYRCAQGGQAVI